MGTGTLAHSFSCFESWDEVPTSVGQLHSLLELASTNLLSIVRYYRFLKRLSMK